MTELNNAWFEFLKEQGASMADAPGSEVTGFGAQSGTEIPAADFMAPLTDLGLIGAAGDDAATFLHNQLTNDVEHLDASLARLAGYCSPKGRLLATILMWKQGDKIMLQLPQQIQAVVQKRLQMFILRAKAKLTDETENFAMLGLSGRVAESSLKKWFPSLPAMPYSKTESAAGMLIRVSDAGAAPRYQWIMSFETARAAWPELIRTIKPAPTRWWRLSDVHAAIPQITQATQEQFVPQMINFEVVGGVNFKKGCYPGQEIVARSQYLGKLKRRMLPASVDTTNVQAGMEIFSSSDAAQPCGMVVNAEPSGPNSFDCLVEIKMAVLEEGNIHLGSVEGPVLQFKNLPYAMPDPA